MFFFRFKKQYAEESVLLYKVHSSPSLTCNSVFCYPSTLPGAEQYEGEPALLYKETL